MVDLFQRGLDDTDDETQADNDERHDGAEHAVTIAALSAVQNDSWERRSHALVNGDFSELVLNLGRTDADGLGGRSSPFPTCG